MRSQSPSLRTGSTVTDRSLFDPSPIEAIRELADKAEADSILGGYFRNARLQIERVEAHAAASDLDSLARQVHAIIGTSGTFGFRGIERHGRRIEQAIESGDRARAIALSRDLRTMAEASWAQFRELYGQPGS
jgi:HPt (histidine-containing phosphotransfer) domain-containing protein